MAPVIVTVTRPTLTAEERAKRMEQIKQAAIRLVIATDTAIKRKSTLINNRRKA